MRSTRSFLAFTAAFALTVLAIPMFLAAPAYGQDSRVALQRGYRTGYSDGYMAGYRDSIDNNSRNIARHKEYTQADRAFSKDYGQLDDYRDGYRQGFEGGYATGFEKRPFESAIPQGLAKRGLNTVPPAEELVSATPLETPVAEPTVDQQPVEKTPEPEVADTAPSYTPAVAEPQQPIRKASFTAATNDIILIPRDTELIVEIQEDLNTEQNRVGDKFTARVVSPVEIEGAIIEGRIEKITKPGRIKRRSQMQLTFDRIVLTEDRWSNYSATLAEVLPIKGDNVLTVSDEGTAVGKRALKEDGIKVGAATGAGLGIGALTAGPVGAAVGAGIGAAFGVGAVVVERGKHIRLIKNQQLKIRTAYDTRIR